MRFRNARIRHDRAPENERITPFGGTSRFAGDQTAALAWP
jgi:hypothetical protein